jgi:nucleotide-binding universal stress UspA family protein
MLPVKRILCPTDFSEPSYQAIKAAAELAEHFSAELLLLHAVTPIPILPQPMVSSSFDVGGYFQEIREAGRTALEEVARTRVPQGVQTRPLVVAGDAATEIARAAADAGADLIVIATHGRTGWRHLVNGSVAEKVVRQARCPVLIIQFRPAEP